MQTVQKIGDSTAQFLEVLDMPVVVHRQVVETVQKTVEIPQLGSLLRPSFCNDRLLDKLQLRVANCADNRRFPQFSFFVVVPVCPGTSGMSPR